MRFWDTSALVPILLEQPTSEFSRRALAHDQSLVVWWGVVVEIESSLARFARERPKEMDVLDAARKRYTELAESWLEIEPTEEVRLGASRLLHRYPLRAGDALQLAAAVVAAGNRPAELTFVSADMRLNTAARREGFRVLAPAER